MWVVELAVFAHNEESTIEGLIGDLARQRIFTDSNVKIRINFLCNGCTDRTVEVTTMCVAESAVLSEVVNVRTFSEGGKSLTWNRFVEDLLDDTEYVIFMDADIRLPDPESLGLLVCDLAANDVSAVTSRPVKSLEVLRKKPLLRLAAKSISREHRDGPIAGSLYIVRAQILQNIRLPVPCLVEDGFLSACLITDLFSHEPHPGRVMASNRVHHFFSPPRSFGEFFAHDIRLALGAELNAALFSDLWEAGAIDTKIGILREFASSARIERNISAHLENPERSALRRRCVIGEAIGRQGESIATRIARFPVRLAHAVYMNLVRLRARNLFVRRNFEW